MAWGKIFESMYEGSMYGSGMGVFAVWGYVISHAHNSRVELNPKKLSDTLGGTEEEVVSAITFLMSPDPHSRFKEHDGRRLLKEGEFQYFIPSWASYQKIRNDIDRREYNRVKQAEYRQRQKNLKSGSGSAREQLYVKTMEEQGKEAAEATLGEPEDEMEVE